MRFVRGLLSGIIGTEAEKLEKLLKEFLRIDKLLSIETKKEYETFFKIEKLIFKKRQLDLGLFEKNRNELNNLIKLFYQFIILEKEILNLFKSDYKKFVVDDVLATNIIREKLSGILVGVKEINQYINDFKEILIELENLPKKDPKEIAEWRKLLFDEFGKLEKDLACIRHNIYEIIAVNKRLEEIEKIKKYFIYRPLCSSSFRKKLKTNPHFEDEKIKGRIYGFIKTISSGKKKGIEIIGEFLVYPGGKGGVSERIAFYRVGNTLRFCEPLFHISKEHYDGKWNVKARKGEITRASYDYGDWKDARWL